MYVIADISKKTACIFMKQDSTGHPCITVSLFDAPSFRHKKDAAELLSKLPASKFNFKICELVINRQNPAQ